MASMRRFTAKSLLLGLALLLAISASALAHLCNGMGRRYCTSAHEARDCPRPCEEKRCKRVGQSSRMKRNGAKPKRPRWEDFVESGLYEHVYVDGNYVCVSSCWQHPWKARCRKWERYDGERYCQRLTCNHDDRSRYSGCHKDLDTGDRKLPWHKPTCDECEHIFPRACKYNNKRKSSDDDDDDDDEFYY
mmetsp:Transcript_15745/g.27963  ORF Transcript_15745/g.27963 Transcript_15745/m.27963 type:complete len:190 (-) Transcript_15745:86-655(-)